MRIPNTLHFAILSAMFAFSGSAHGDAPVPGKVFISGTVPDLASKASVLAKLRAVYGPGMVTDDITVGDVTAPSNWNAYVDKLITPELKLITGGGRLKIDGTKVSVDGEVASAAVSRTIAGNFAASLDSTYTVNNALRVTQVSVQDMVIKILREGTVAFENGKSQLTPSGRALLDKVAVPLIATPASIEVIGHTDNLGMRAANQALSEARAGAVKAYLGSRGVNPDLITTSGKGQDQPLGGNGSAAERARNRRIEFKFVQSMKK